MVTSLFYYDSYKPYIIEDGHNEKIKMASARDFVTSTEGAYTFSYYLNKSSKKEITSYISQVVTSFNNLKSISNFLALRLNDKKIVKNGIDSSAGQIENFAKCYNQFIDFCESNENAKTNFEDYVTSVSNVISENEDVLIKVGFYLDEKGKLVKDEESYTSERLLSCDKFTLNNLKYVYDAIYQRTCNSMRDPLTDCMSFRDFSCYYNYGLYDSVRKSFPLIENGLLVSVGV